MVTAAPFQGEVALNVMRYPFLQPLIHSPRLLDATVEKICGKTPLLRGEAYRWKEEMSNARVVYAAVVRANSVLFDPKQVGRAPAVIAYTCEARGFDELYMAQLLSTIERASLNPADAAQQAMALKLNNPDSDFSMLVPPRLTAGAAMRLETTLLDPNTLPGGVIPEDHLIPGLAIPSRFMPVSAELLA